MSQKYWPQMQHSPRGPPSLRGRRAHPSACWPAKPSPAPSHRWGWIQPPHSKSGGPLAWAPSMSQHHPPSLQPCCHVLIGLLARQTMDPAWVESPPSHVPRSLDVGLYGHFRFHAEETGSQPEGCLHLLGGFLLSGWRLHAPSHLEDLSCACLQQECRACLHPRSGHLKPGCQHMHCWGLGSQPILAGLALPGILLREGSSRKGGSLGSKPCSAWAAHHPDLSQGWPWCPRALVQDLHAPPALRWHKESTTPSSKALLAVCKKISFAHQAPTSIILQMLIQSNKDHWRKCCMRDLRGCFSVQCFASSIPQAVRHHTVSTVGHPPFPEPLHHSKHDPCRMDDCHAMTFKEAADGYKVRHCTQEMPLSPSSTRLGELSWRFRDLGQWPGCMMQPAQPVSDLVNHSKTPLTCTAWWLQAAQTRRCLASKSLTSPHLGMRHPWWWRHCHLSCLLPEVTSQQQVQTGPAGCPAFQ